MDSPRLLVKASGLGSHQEEKFVRATGYSSPTHRASLGDGLFAQLSADGDPPVRSTITRPSKFSRA